MTPKPARKPMRPVKRWAAVDAQTGQVRYVWMNADLSKSEAEQLKSPTREYVQRVEIRPVGRMEGCLRSTRSSLPPVAEAEEMRVVERGCGWIYYDDHGKDYGPYDSRDEALIRGPIAACKEEKLLRRSDA